jgi:hypothetical protein
MAPRSTCSLDTAIPFLRGRFARGADWGREHNHRASFRRPPGSSVRGHRSGGSRSILTPDFGHPIPTLQIVNHDESIIVRSFKQALKTFRRGLDPSSRRHQPMNSGVSILSHALPGMRRRRGSPGIGLSPSAARRLTSTPNTGGPHRRDSLGCQFRLRGPRSLRGRKPRHQPGGGPAVLPAICCAAADHANNWYHRSAESRRDVPQGYPGVRSIQVRIG